MEVVAMHDTQNFQYLEKLFDQSDLKIVPEYQLSSKIATLRLQTYRTKVSVINSDYFGYF